MRRAVPRRRAAAEPHQFGRAAADVEQDDALGLPDRPAACSRWRRAAPRSRGRRFRARCRPRSRTRSRNSRPLPADAAGLGRDQPRAGDAAVAHLGAADAQRIDRAHDRGLAQPAGAGDALAEPDDARERVDDAEAVAGRRAPPAAGSCWCRDRARHRSGRTRPARPPAVIVARVPIRRPPAPPGPLRIAGQARGRGRSPGPRRPSKTFPRAEALRRLDGAAVISNFGAKCSSGGARRNSGRAGKNMARTARLCL